MEQTLVERIEQLWPIGQLPAGSLVSLVRDGLAYEFDHGASMDEVFAIFQEYDLLAPEIDSERLEEICRWKKFSLNVPKRPPKLPDYNAIAIKAAETKRRREQEFAEQQREELRRKQREAAEQAAYKNRWGRWADAVRSAEQQPSVPKRVDRIPNLEYSRLISPQRAQELNFRASNRLLQQAMGPQYVIAAHPFDKRYVESLLDQVDLTWPDAMTCVRFYDSQHRDYPSYLHFINLSFEPGKGRPAAVLIEFSRTTVGTYEGPLEIFKNRENPKESDVFIFEDGERAEKIQTLIRQNSPYTVFRLLQHSKI